MKLVQDDYHRDVASYVGLLRVGPKGQRLDRDDYKAMKVDAEQTRIMLRDIEVRNEANEAGAFRWPNSEKTAKPSSTDCNEWGRTWPPTWWPWPSVERLNMHRCSTSNRSS